MCVVGRETDEITSVLFCCESLFLYAHWKVCFWMHIDTSAEGKKVSVVKKGWVTRHEHMHMCTHTHTPGNVEKILGKNKHVAESG